MKRLITALILALSIGAWATPTGLLNIPTAETVKMFKGGVVQSTTQDLFTQTEVNLFPGYGLEFGTDYNTDLDTDIDNVIFNVKYVLDIAKLMKGTLETPFSVGVGLMDIRDGYPVSYFITARTALSPNIFLNGGYINRTNSYSCPFKTRAYFPRFEEEEVDQWFIGAEMKVDEHLSLMIDYTDNAIPTYNNTEAISTSVGMRYSWSDFSLEAGILFVRDGEEDPQAVVKFSFVP